MSSLTKKTKPDRSKIDAANPVELKYWTKAMGLSKETLVEAIQKVGNAAATVRKELGNQSPSQEIVNRDRLSSVTPCCTSPPPNTR